MATQPGGFIWYELLTRDPVAAELFYADVVGWTFESFEGPAGGARYRIAQANGTGIGGVMAIPAAAPGMHPAWFGYLHVADADAAVEEVLAAGGSAHMPVTQIPSVGRIAMLADPQGAAFYIMEPGIEGESTSFSATAIGHVVWNELTTSDTEGALAFYGRQFGWTRGEPVPMGAMGNYEILVRDGVPIGGAMARAGDARLPSAWTFYVRVTDLDAAAERVRTGGGTLLFGPAEVPGGARVVMALDPQGAPFGLLAST